MRKLISLIFIFTLTIISGYGSPIQLYTFNDHEKLKVIELPSGVSVSATEYLFCEAGCEDFLVESSSKKWMLLGLVAVGIFILKDDCCCDSPPGIPQFPPTGILPPELLPPPPTPVPEPSYLLVLGISLIYGKIKKRRKFINKKTSL